ncbi:hypothetical protein [uncultured Lutibacter sp.]|uniref:DUF6970 domain-containing protein n=1 Tax=uncultured Lutibacter sp. TaxID=437739 RepID=UPI00261569B5|nr:hypothetical protein [uncultured Lutibacter sp.]
MAKAINKKKHLFFMKKAHVFLMLTIALTLFNTSCNKSDLDIDVPACIESKIIAIQNNSVTNPPTEVWRWVDNNKVYYYITSDCCDQFNLLYDTQCNLICAPDGGFSGQGDGNCPTFSNNITKTLVWIDERN